jgi:hypothetical protein
MMTQALDHQATRLHDSGRVARAARVVRIVGWWAAFEGWVRLLLAAAGTFHACWRNLSPMVISRSITHIRRFLDLLQTHFITHLHKSHSMNDWNQSGEYVHQDLNRKHQRRMWVAFMALETSIRTERTRRTVVASKNRRSNRPQWRCGIRPWRSNWFAYVDVVEVLDDEARWAQGNLETVQVGQTGLLFI